MTEEKQEEMQSVGAALEEAIRAINPDSKLLQAMREAAALTPKERVQRAVDQYNAQRGHLDETTGGYDCKKCLNRGDRAVLEERDGAYYDVYPPCECMKIRRSIWRIMESGLAKTMKEQTLKTFDAKADWQKHMLDSAQRYIKEGAKSGAWFFIGGQVGSGKTHLCTGIARELLYSGMELRYMVWGEESKKLKALAGDVEYAEELRKWQQCDVLYIDDLFKPVKDDSGRLKPPTDADVRLSFDLLNYRYINRMATIISSERFSSEIVEIDEAVGSRIYERAKDYCEDLKRDAARNHRLLDNTLI